MTQEILTRLQYLKKVSKDCEKWLDPLTDQIWWVNLKNGNRDWRNAKAY